MSGHAGVPNSNWWCVNAVNSSGDRVSKACCHIERIGLSVDVGGCESVRGAVMGVILVAAVACGLWLGGWPPPRGSSCALGALRSVW